MVMTKECLVEKLINYAGDDYTEDQLSFVEDCVESAISEVCGQMYPWDVESDTVRETLRSKALARYPWVVNRVAQFHYDKMGKEGVTTFYESGQTTSFGTGGTPPSFFASIIPIAKVI